MADLKITDLIDEKDIEKVKLLGAEIEKVKTAYGEAAKELAKGLKMKIEVVGDLDKLNAIVVAQAKKADSATNDLNAALKKQSELVERVAKSLDEQVKSGNLSATEMKKVTDASRKNAEALEKLAKAETTVEKAQRASNTVKRTTNVTEQERHRIIADAIAATNKEVHSIHEANEMNKQLRHAVKLVRDTDEDYLQTLGRLNSTIGVNTDYVKRNSDRYTQQKMTIGDYTESVKRAWMEIQRGNSSMKSMGIIAKSTGNLLKSNFNAGVKQVTLSVSTMIKGMVGAQAVIGGIRQLFSLLKQGIHTAIEFEAANSKLAAILGTTSKNTKDLQRDARELGATTKYTASEATNLQIELAKLGFTAREIKDSTQYILRFAQATGAELPEAAALSGAALRMFNADTKETERYVSAMAIATSKSALSFSYLATALPIVGPVANAFNFTIEDTLALLGKLADAGFDASSAATATRNILLNLADSGGKLAKELGKPVKSLPELVDGLKSLTEKGVDLNTTLELTDKRSVAAFNAFLTAVDKIIPLREQVTGVDGELKDMANTMGDNVEGALKGMSSAWDEFMLTIMNSKGKFKDVIDYITSGIRGLTETIKGGDAYAEKQEKKALSDAQDYSKKYTSIIHNRFNSYKKEFIDKGLSEEKAYNKALEKIQAERKDIQAIDRWNIRKQKYKIAGMFEDDSFLSLKNLNPFHRPKVQQQLQDEVSSMYKNVFSLAASDAWNEAIDSIPNFLDFKKDESSPDTSNTHKLTDEEKKALEKAAKEKLKIEQELQDSKISLMDEGLEKELAKIAHGYNKKIAAIKGGSNEEKALIDSLGKQMQKEVAAFTEAYNLSGEKKNISNRLATVQKDTKEELDLKMQMLDLERENEINAAEKSGQDVFLIDEKYQKKRQDLLEEFASKQILLIADNAAAEQAVRDRQLQTDLLDLKKRKETENMSAEQYAEEEYRIKLDYVRKTTEAAIDAIEQELNVDNLSAKDRAKLTEDLYKLKEDLANKEAEAEITAIEKINKADEKAYKERIRNLKKWLQTASQAIGAIGDLVGTLYDGQLDKIEEESEANTNAHDAEVERIDLLKEQKIISEDEAQARKRAAEDKTRKKEEELEKKRRDVQYKQAVWDKAMNISNIIAGTALAVINALQTKPFIPAGLAAAAVAGTMGALQLATAMATPIPKYAKGTDNHIGGPAIVGDGGKQEVVVYSGKAWITPDVPTIIDLPRGAEVLPDADRYLTHTDFINFNQRFAENGGHNVVVNNDYSLLNRELKGMRDDIRKMTIQQHRDAYDLNYERYKRDRL